MAYRHGWRFVSGLLLAVVLGGCGAPFLAKQPRDFKVVQPGVQVSLDERNPGDHTQGAPLTLVLRSQPVALDAERGPSFLRPVGPVATAATEMRFCVAVDEPCELPQQWLPFQAEVEAPLAIDWLGERTVWAVVEFRDGAGPVVAIGDAAADTTVRLSRQIVAAAAPTTAPAPQATATAEAAGIPGVAIVPSGMVATSVGKSLNLEVLFTPPPAADAMRLTTGFTCQDEAALAAAEWEPLAASRVFAYRADTASMMPWSVSVQYRGADGALSAVFCATSTIEAHP